LRIYRAAFSGLPRDVWLLCGVLLINRAGGMVLPFLALFLTQARGLSAFEAGRLMSLYGVGSVIGSFFGGWLSDRIGTLRTQQLTLLIGGAGYLAFMWLERPWVIAVAMLLISIVYEGFRPAAMAAMAERAPAGLQARAFALLRLAANLGVSVGPAVGGLLAVYSYDWLFIGDAVTCWLAAGVLAVALGAESPHHIEQRRLGRAQAASPLRDGPFLLLLLLVVALAAAIFQVFSTLPLYLRQFYGYRENVIGLLLGFNALLIVLFEMVLIHLTERWNRLLMTGCGAFLVCAGLALLPFGSSVAFVALTVAVWTVGEMLSLPMTNTLVAERAGQGNRGRYMGLYTMAFSIAFVIAPLAGTWVLERHGPRTLWFGTGVLGFVLLAGALALIPAFRRTVSADAKG